MMQQDLVVIGGGTSGLITAIGALRLGLKVTLIDKNKSLGGLALHNGCVPSKTFIRVAHITNILHNAEKLGIDCKISPTQLYKVNDYVATVTDSFQAQEIQEVYKTFNQLGGIILTGAPRFIDKHVIAINEQYIYAKKIVIATGSRPFYPAIPGLNEIGYITTDEVFKQQELWPTLTILGDDVTAIELAQAFARLGAKVTIIARNDTILPTSDPELVKRLSEILLSNGIEIYVSSKAQHAYMQGKYKVLECRHESGDIYTIASDEILVVLGRRPNIEGLALENAGVAYVKEGIVVDRKLRTSTRHIYALGDVINSPYKLTHVAEYQASILLSNMLFKYPAKVKYQGFPYVIFTEPEYAHVGLTETQAKEQGYKNLQVFRFEYKNLDSAIINNKTQGIVKVVTARKRVIGATILGAHASNLIAEWGLAINLKAKINDVAATIHAYPTFAQLNRRVASKQMSKDFFAEKNKSFVNLLQKVFA